ncbi:dihydrolipoyllysine-residue acetyltransferase [Glaciecola sp. MH2013]|uniref:dihydrolipoyllysine-residue acetyltransferase n=1 Tax=Glaciecola sp. MH2013 TaxID=2785524 RepID=UPI0018A0650F|nr:dihydrolipoyllysine-residue acetyltransferase [Glaciecola sp. MH2013]MBF7072778.1 dihydrolipoyllysine-residue acetyltransferase [Glaciecola sp. MH2013]
MMTDFILPDIGEGIVECELLEWLVAEGDLIVEDQPVAEVMTDKATVQIPAMHNGIVTRLHYKEGDIAKVHAPLFAMEIEGDTSSQHEDSEQQETPRGKMTENPAAASTKTEAFILPDIGEGIVECEIVKWCINEGDEIVEDQVVVEVMTDKAVVEIPAKFSGRVTTLHYQQGDIAQVHTPLFDQVIAIESGHYEDTAVAESDVATDSNAKDDYTKASDAQLDSNKSTKVLASPAVRRVAREHKITISDVKGSGKKGRVLKEDIEAFVNSKSSLNTQKVEHNRHSEKGIEDQKLANAQTQSQQTSVSDNVSQVIPMRGIKAAMAKQMVASVSTIPHFTVSDELNMDKLIALRKQLKPEFEQQGIKLSFMPFFIKALSLALREYPVINSRLSNDASELHYLSAHNIGMAVDSKIGLLVPNIKNVESLSLFDVAKECDRIVNAAREGKLSNSDLSGGTISISNIGAIGGITATPVINKPEVAIVALGKTQTLPRFNELGEVSAHNIMMVNWSGDHRVIDGASMVRFNNLWMSYLKDPERMLMHLS